MGTFAIKDVDKYGGQGNGSFFKLENDKDTALVRLMYNTDEEVVGIAVHEIQVEGKRRYVSCLRSYNEPTENCPLCAKGERVIAKVFVFMYDLDADEVKIWERGKTIISKISSLGIRYNPLVSMPFEIERNGKPGETSTKYEFYPTEADDVTLEDLPEVPEVIGNIVLDKSFEELEFFVENSCFDEESEPTTKKSAPVTRRANVTATRRTAEPRKSEAGTSKAPTTQKRNRF